MKSRMRLFVVTPVAGGLLVLASAGSISRYAPQMEHIAPWALAWLVLTVSVVAMSLLRHPGMNTSKYWQDLVAVSILMGVLVAAVRLFYHQP